ncbi:MAG: ABC transporter permease, partial [Alphaproteobacteria bacterium]
MMFATESKIALRDIRGQIGRFWVLIVCLMLGVGAIAAVNSVSLSMTDSLGRDGQSLLGGDLEFRLIQRPASQKEREALESVGQVSEVSGFRTMARTVATENGGTKQRLVELKSVDGAYPLYGGLELKPEISLEKGLGLSGNVHGTLVDQALLSQLSLKIGDVLQVGTEQFEIRGVITRETDRAIRGFNIGPRVLISKAGLAKTGLVQPGSLISYYYRLKLPETANATLVSETLKGQFPDAGWRVKTLADASPQTKEFVERLAMFLTLVGLSVLLVGGVGVANAVTAYMTSKVPTLATFKSLGASLAQVQVIYLIQVLLLSSLGISLGLLIGVLAPALMLPVLSASLNLDLVAGIDFPALALAACFGFLTAIGFSILPISKSAKTPAAQLFRDPNSSALGKASKLAILLAGLTLALMFALAILTSSAQTIAAIFIVSSVVAMGLFLLIAWLIQLLVKVLPRPKKPLLRFALANLIRPGAPTPSVVLSLGLGLTLLVIIGLTQANLRSQISENLPENIPSFFIMDMKKSQTATFDALAEATPDIKTYDRTPMMRGKISKINGRDPSSYDVPEDIAWMVDGNSSRGITWSEQMPKGTNLTAGEWWPADYAGKQLVSIDEKIAQGLGLKLGDTLTVNLLGREIQAEISSLRAIDFRTLQINFLLVFSPGIISKAPQMNLATLETDQVNEDAIEKQLIDEFPNLTIIRIRYILEQVQGLLSKLANSIALIASLALIAGVFVLAGALAAGRQRRKYETVVLKVLGSTRKQLLFGFLIEYGLLGLVAGFTACLLGTFASYQLVTRIFEFEFQLAWGLVFGATAIGLFVTLFFGFIST